MAQTTKKYTPKKDEGLWFCTRMETDAQYPGGADALKKFIENQIVIPDSFTDTMTTTFDKACVIQYKIEKDGSASGFAIVQSAQPAIDTICLRALQKMQSWTPASQNGRTVTAYKKQSIRIFIEAEEIDTKKTDCGDNSNYYL